MRNIILCIGLFVVLSYKAQQNPLPLNTLMDDIPQGAYVKDLNNEFAPYIGTYKANYKGNEITLFIIKEENRPTNRSTKTFFRDALSIKYTVKNSSGLILQDTYSNNSSNIQLYSLRVRSYDNSVAFYYSGTNCKVGWGSIILKKLNSTQLSWEYYPNSRIITDATCPPGTDTTVYLPHTKGLIFTKQ